jgi:hypothetical protein
MRLITTKYTEFLDLRINENLNQARKYLKDKWVKTNSIIKVVPNTIISNSYDAIDKDSGDIIDINNLTEEQKILAETDFATDVYLRNNDILNSIMTASGATKEDIDNFYISAAER